MALLNPDEWAEVQRLFELAGELPPEEQSAFLDRACPRAELRQEVFSLLRSSDARLPAAAAAIRWTADVLSVESDPDERLIGARLGPYRVEAIVGHGGMGAVYRASRDDSEFHQQVAIKLVRMAAESRNALLRFRRERQILARLNHPNIARLLDGGSTPEGMPYLVMEFIEGSSITSWCENRHLALKDRLQLFLLVCQAVEFAHREQIVHRDLKPANILVTGDGVPKLLDFGIAKMLDRDTQAETVTRTGMHVMTPEYAAPEQVRGEPISPASDVYSLGLILYELLTETQAQNIPTPTPVVIARVVCSMEPLQPATVNPQLAGDLDNIIRKAIRKEPDRRYAAAGDLARDIQLHLEGRPVSARPDTFTYRFSKFARRNRLALSSTGLLVLLAVLLVFSLTTLRTAAPRVAQVIQITQSGRVNITNGVATDGSRVFFTEGAGGGWWLASAPVKGGPTTPLPVTPRLNLADIQGLSPDRSSLLIALHSNTDDGRQLWIVPTAGGAAHRVGNVTGRNAAWCRDGRHIVFAMRDELFQVSVNGLELHRLGAFHATILDMRAAPAPLPEILRFTLPGNGPESSLWETSLDHPALKPLFQGWKSGDTGEDSGFWLPSGRFFLFRSHHEQTFSIWATEQRSGLLHPFESQPARIYSSPLEFASLAASPDSKRIFMPAGQERRELMRYDATRGQFVPFLPGVAGRYASFSPDGKQVAYTTFLDGALWCSKPDGSQGRQLTPPSMISGMARWSPDGTRLVFAASDSGGPNGVYIVAVAGGRPQSYGPGAWEPSWSPDGTRLLVGLDVPTQGLRPGLHVLDLKTREMKPIPGSEGLERAAWSPDPRYVAASNGKEIELFDFRTQRWSVLAAGDGLGIPFWSRDGSYVLYEENFGDPDQPIYSVNVASRKIERLMGLKQIPQSNVTRYGLAGIAPGDSPIASVIRNNADIYSLELDLH